MRKFILFLVFFLAIVFIFLSFSELQSIADTLRHSNLWYFSLALLVEIGWMFNMGMTFHALYKLIGLEEDILRLALVSVAASFVNVVAPSMGMGGMAVFVNDGNRRGLPPGKVTAASALFILLDYAAFLCVLALGLIVLVRRNNLDTGEIIASLILLAISLALGALLYIGSRSAERLGNVLARGAHIINKMLHPFFHREYLHEHRAHEFASEIAEGLAEIRQERKKLLIPMLYALNNKMLRIVILLLMFLAFKVPFSAGTIIGGFAIGYLFLIVSITPSGIGIMEGVLALALNSLGVAWSQAVVLTLFYRAATLWFPLGLGAWAFRYLQKGKAAEA